MLLYFSICLSVAFSVYILCMLFCVVGVVCFLCSICVLDIVILLLCGDVVLWCCVVGGVGGVVCGVMFVFGFVCIVLLLLFDGKVVDCWGLGTRVCVLVDLLRCSKYGIISLILFSLNTFLVLVLLRRGRE